MKHRTTISRRGLVGALCGAAPAGVAGPAFAQDKPECSVEFQQNDLLKVRVGATSRGVFYQFRYASNEGDVRTSLSLEFSLSGDSVPESAEIFVFSPVEQNLSEYNGLSLAVQMEIDGERKYFATRKILEEYENTFWSMDFIEATDLNALMSDVRNGEVAEILGFIWDGETAVRTYRPFRMRLEGMAEAFKQAERSANAEAARLQAEECTSATKIVCTKMNETYGFGSFRNAIWIEHSAAHMTACHEKGYHLLAAPLIAFAYSDGDPARRLVRYLLERAARERTADIYACMRGKKRRFAGVLCRTVLEPLCWSVGYGASLCESARRLWRTRESHR